MSDYDYQSYEKCLEKILESTQKDYWAQYIDINRHQVNVGRTYLWVSAALVGAYSAGYQNFEQYFSNITVIIIFIISFSFAIIAFGFCLYSIPARKGYQAVHKEGWGEFSHYAYNLLCEKKEHLYSVFLTDFISKFDIAHRYSFTTNQKRANLLRITSWLLIFSVIFAILGLTAMSVNYKYSVLFKEKTMTESNNASGSTSDNKPVSADKPNVPVPPAPAGSQGGQIHTHSDNSPIVTIITEDTGTKK